jgi:putative membrane protein
MCNIIKVKKNNFENNNLTQQKMKKLVNTSKIILGAALLSLTMNACKNEPKHDDPVATTENENETNFEDNDVADDSSYLNEAAKINIMEIQMGKLAQQKSMTPEVKKYAAMMVADHTKSLDELRIMANNKTITLPTEIEGEGLEEYNELKEKSGAEFDKMYMEMMTESHQKGMDKMTEISQKVSDEDVKLWTSRQVEGMITHHEEAKKIQSKRGY